MSNPNYYVPGKPTPGPWFLEDPSEGGRVLAWATEEDSLGRQRTQATVIHVPPGSPMNTFLRADARLIAAAPEMLRLLSEIQSKLNFFGHFSQDTEEALRLRDLLDYVRDGEDDV
ncbi:MAG: hypothetical protein LC650_03170 [Actinobacteria bacterium]|nr:hypothetical protein [Actinomycetota bacterium]